MALEDGKMGWVVSDAQDYKGNPADRSKTGGWIPAALILGIEMCERLSTMGIAVNLVTYLIGTMHLPSSTSANVVTDFMGTSFLLCLLGGFVADAFLGRFKTIAIFAVVQLLGTGMLALSTKLPEFRPPPCDTTKPDTCQKATDFQMGILYLALYLIALGTGGLKSSVSGFGSDQFDEKDEKEKAQMTAFFSRFFFFISLVSPGDTATIILTIISFLPPGGTAAIFTIISFFTQKMLPCHPPGGTATTLTIISFWTLMAVTVLVWVQDEVGRSWAYGICSVSMGIAIAVFLGGVKRYRYKKSVGSPVVSILQVVTCAIRKSKLQMPYDVSMLYEDNPDSSRIQHTQPFGCLDKAAIVTEDDFERTGMRTGGAMTANPWKVCSITRIEEVKMMAGLLPVWATTIIFWTTYAQMITFSVEQASTMERSLGKNFQIPAGSLTVFFVAAILLSLAVYDRLIVPLWKSWKGKPGFTNLQRIAIGLVLSILGMAVAALAERKRLSVANSVGRNTQSLPISVYYLIPQFFLVGAGEAFIYTGQLDFFITQSPKSMKTMSTGLFLTTLSLGFFLSSFLVSVVTSITATKDSQGWLADNINYGRLDCFYGLLALLSFVNYVVFMVCAIWYKPNRKQDSSSKPLKMINGNGNGPYVGHVEEKC